MSVSKGRLELIVLDTGWSRRDAKAWMARNMWLAVKTSRTLRESDVRKRMLGLIHEEGFRRAMTSVSEPRGTCDG